ncbi:short-chain dehydrogenase/reductase SDR [Pediococcus damnosus]|uniref:Short-chain dehydrogenase/reductase SDR n=1 Tax=Pediococcus damnosus TaxID=51663 RepID=A0A0R2HM14_9LACO|nr:SDR family oxidoreductase [Pediococcus damnosus]AMV61042.1 short-chain dehydrogenase/reductase SDR [Pediococcus damnosus]AMV63611.1 short-chain dehydrogenase/reductase SDR [Pediococcus damnosus]AMV65402.1 short-chain dehydrogenase/reductase SDR [Pediococcus damnosus]AMV66448.1 short-chain dehydrogenase/reductase SDR [Pediococcus damnosus]KJU73560.1 short-chain dehydrogenase [Pediococcus damnosus LMG 28219]
MKRLTGKVAIITGASSGFGRGTALAFAAEGCNLVLTARRKQRLREVVTQCEKLGVEAIYFADDAQEENTALETVKLAIKTFGKIDILINNAGIGRTLSLTDTSMSDYDLIMNTNVRSAFAFTKAAVPNMLERHDGQIILVSSVTGIVGHANETAYTASKFALRGLGQALDKELLDQGIRTCVFCPHAGATEFEVGHGRTTEGVAASGFLTPKDVGQALLSVCVQPKNSRIVELRLASNNVKY